MTRSFTTWAAFALMFVTRPVTVSCADDNGGPLRLTLPTEFHAVVGDEMSMYFDNLVLTETPGSYRFTVECDIGQVGERRWTVRPVSDDLGQHDVKVTVADAGGTVLGSATTTLDVVAAEAGAYCSIRLLIVGDSLTHATAYPNEIARLLSRPGSPSWKMLGTHRPAAAATGVAHEGYGGWTWQRFASHHEPNPDGTHRKRSSPFVYLGADGKPRLDVKRYLEEECDARSPDFCIFLLGINDCFSADPEDPAAIDARIDTMMEHADTLLAAFGQAAPRAELAICLTTPPNSRQEAFESNYKGRYPRWGWKRIQHRLVERQIEKFASRQHEQYHIVPTQLNLDPIDGYPANNGVHPDESGYREIGASIHAWLKSRLMRGNARVVPVSVRPEVPGTLALYTRSRRESPAGSGRFEVVGDTVEWAVAETAIIVCDMWSDHPCKLAAQRVGAMAPRMNAVISRARGHGVMIIHAPSGGVRHYAATPYRKRLEKAPPAAPLVPLQGWCHLDPSREAPLPIDDSDGGCDDPHPRPNPGFDRRQHPALDIVGFDGVSESGVEIYNFFRHAGIRNIVLMGVHANMCVLGRPFGIRQMTNQGMNVVLVRDLTDAMYDPRDRPFVSHTRGTEMIVEHIETYWCPSILGEELTRVVPGSADPRPPAATKEPAR